MKPVLGTFNKYPALVDALPALVRKQRRLEKQLAPLEKLAVDEKAVRAQIDELLVDAGIAKGEGVTCAGYDVVHNERAGQSKLDADRLRVAGVAELDIKFATVTGQAAKFATVRPMKGSSVRAPQAKKAA